MGMTKNISFLIVNLRSKLGLSRASFAKKLGVSPSQMKRIEVGEAKPDDELIQNICDIYNVNSTYFEGAMDLNDAVHVSDPKEEKKSVGKRVKQIRVDNNKTLKELSELVNLSDSQLCLIENGESNLTKKRAADIATVLHVGVEWLLYGDEKKKEHPVDQTMIEWLWNHPEIRKEIWEQIIQNK